MAIRICIIGCGNISNTRHIPAIIKNNEAKIVGLISDSQQKVDRTLKNHSCLKDCFHKVLSCENDIFMQLKEVKWFIDEVDAVVIGTPPKQHFPVAEACLKLGKHTLVEKPMMMKEEECKKVIELSDTNEKVFAVMHSFQFANGILKMDKMIKEGKLGTIRSILEIQLSNRERRLPVWYNDLPLGLFFDEASHFFYCANRFGGKLEVENAHAVFNSKEDATPKFLEVQMMAGDVPVQMMMNFNSPICEWGIILVGSDRIAIYDYFKDILIVLDNDGQHLAKNVLKTSASFSWQFWKGFVSNGFKMVTGNLLYGHDKCINNFVSAIVNGDRICRELSPELGLEVVHAMNEVVRYATEH